MVALTKKQIDTLQFIVGFYAREMKFPSFRDICRACDLYSTSSAYNRIARLSRAGYVLPGRHEGCLDGWRLSPKALAFVDDRHEMVKVHLRHALELCGKEMQGTKEQITEILNTL